MAARRLQRERPGLTVVTGTNLATLLDFAVRTSDLSPADAARHAAEKGRAAAARGRGAGGRVALELFRIDDRLIHGQVVVGWGQPLDLGFIVLVDDEVAAQRLGAGALPHGRAAGDGRLLRLRRSRPPTDSPGYQERPPRGPPPHRRHRDHARLSMPRHHPERQPRRHPPSRRPRAAAALRLPRRPTRRPRCARLPPAASPSPRRTCPPRARSRSTRSCSARGAGDAGRGAGVLGILGAPARAGRRQLPAGDDVPPASSPPRSPAPCSVRRSADSSSARRSSCFALETLPFGASRYPEWGSARSSAAPSSPSPVTGAAARWCSPCSRPSPGPGSAAGRWCSCGAQRPLGARAARRRVAGRAAVVTGLQLYGLTADLLRGAAMTIVGLLLFVRRDAPGARAVEPVAPAVAGRARRRSPRSWPPVPATRSFTRPPGPAWLLAGGVLVGLALLGAMS